MFPKDGTLHDMKFITQQQKLEQFIALAHKVAPSRTTLPILSNVYIGSDNGRLKIASTNLEVSFAAWLGASIEEEGEVTVSTNLLHNYIQNLAPEKLTLATQGTTFRVIGSTTAAEFLTMPAQEFPEFPSVRSSVLLRLSPGRLQEILKKVLFAAATSDARPVLTGVLFRGTPEGVIIVATDGFRLAEVTVDWKTLSAEAPDEAFEMIIPARMLKDIGQFSADASSDGLWDVRLTEDNNQVVFSSPDVQLFARRIEAEFPQYENIIPKEHSVTMTAEKEALIRAIRTAALFAQSQSHTVQLQMNTADQTVRVFAESKELGKQESTLPVSMSGETITAGFNATYLIDAVSAFDGEQIVLQMKTPEAPALFVSPGVDTHIRQVVMPVRLERSTS